MKPELVVLKTKSDQSNEADKDALVRLFDDLAERARGGEIVAVVAAVQERTGYVHHRIGMTYQMATGVVARMMHLLMRDWDSRL